MLYNIRSFFFLVIAVFVFTFENLYDIIIFMEKTVKEKFLNVPNCLSLLRIAMIPLYWVLYFSLPAYYAVAVFALAAITDVVDGVIARRFNLITKYGKVLDPLADKLMQVSALLSLSITGDVSWIITSIIFLKECYMILGAGMLYNKHVVVYSNIYGKLATVLLNFGTGLTILAVALDSLSVAFHATLRIIALVILIAGATLNLIAGAVYTVITVRSLKGKISDNNEENEKIDIKF